MLLKSNDLLAATAATAATVAARQSFSDLIISIIGQNIRAKNANSSCMSSVLPIN